MNNNNMVNIGNYLKSEYNAADRGLVINYSSTKSALYYLKAIKNFLLSSDEEIVVSPASQAYSYFLTECKENITFERNNIIFPNCTRVVLSRKRSNLN